MSCPVNVWITCPVVVSHNLKSVGQCQLVEASHLPSGLNARLRPSKVRASGSLRASQTLIVPSALPEASCIPSGLKAT